MLFDDTYGPGIIGDVAWMQIPGLPNGYEVSEFGAIRQPKGGSYLYRKLARSKEGYLRIDFTIKGKRIHSPVHRLILRAFRPWEKELEQVDHINTICWDNRLENIRWVSAAINNRNPLTAEHRRISMRKRSATDAWKQQISNMVAAAIKKSSRPVICVETGERYISIADASRKTGISKNAILTSCATEHTRQYERTDRKGKRVYHFSYAD